MELLQQVQKPKTIADCNDGMDDGVDRMYHASRKMLALIPQAGLPHVSAAGSQTLSLCTRTVVDTRNAGSSSLPFVLANA
jgi:hypothetical protein